MLLIGLIAEKLQGRVSSSRHILARDDDSKATSMMLIADKSKRPRTLAKPPLPQASKQATNLVKGDS